MTRFNKRNAPKGWMYPFNKKEIMSIIDETGALFKSVNFENTEKPSKYSNDEIWCWVGILSSKRVDGKCIFSLELSSFKEQYIKPWKQNIIKLVGEEMKKWIERKLKQPENSPEKPTQLFLKYKIKNGLLTSSCFEVD